jgi:hypothetical protein
LQSLNLKLKALTKNGGFFIWAFPLITKVCTQENAELVVLNVDFLERKARQRNRRSAQNKKKN